MRLQIFWDETHLNRVDAVRPKLFPELIVRRVNGGCPRRQLYDGLPEVELRVGVPHDSHVLSFAGGRNKKCISAYLDDIDASNIWIVKTSTVRTVVPHDVSDGLSYLVGALLKVIFVIRLVCPNVALQWRRVEAFCVSAFTSDVSNR